ncbi:SusD/RagB family nutrient-binding outer membrane lipoprotein [Segetibacter sp. 3557_3]|uniref:SusD/RagB family nutrient-binding outer membrane lipoprotein n=1 Tax=Segetibacter sp. 3557_3 TaxID=2547429 RepID=UPI0010587812|nr:SusD/RagB family nutrient-binding outer membrane lipoprotein [Segetibacter sp. 3557_3]TDH21311.1 SusD/RagB family nutrient-binding outer membrane lipoprotein [Segetibacter sp. 3557_3]
MKFIYTALAFSLLFSSCKKYDFGDINTNPDPNVKSIPNTAELFTNVTRQIAGDLTISDATPGIYVQYFSETQYPGASLYNISRSDWTDYYALRPVTTDLFLGGVLESSYAIINLNTDPSTAPAAAQNGSNKNQIAIARIMKAYFFSIVTDRWGDIPYSEALTGAVSPKYDKQMDIYTDLFKELTEAVEQFETASTTVKGELLFKGDPLKWKRFANSLRMILAMRISNADPAKARTQFLAAYNDPAGWIDDNSKNAAFPFLNNRNFRNPWNEKIDQRDDLAPSNVFIDTLNALSDRRIAAYATQASPGVYRGAPFGWNQGAIQTWASNNLYSRIGTKITAMDAPGYLVTAAQMQLVKAEAALKGWIPVTEISAYNFAIRQSWEQWGVYDAAAFTSYINNPRVNIGTGLGDAEGIKRKIGLQKWISLYPNGQEEWSEWRRLNYPTLAPARDAGGVAIPKRMGYPGNEPTLNGANYQSQVATMPGGDTPNTPVWWDK